MMQALPRLLLAAGAGVLALQLAGCGPQAVDYSKTGPEGAASSSFSAPASIPAKK
jgi:hypothetical protein